MFGAIFIGLSGMEAYSDGLRQLSNNITNLNSDGFKQSDISFNNLFRTGSESISYSNGQPSTGGGVELAELTIDFLSGELRTTENDLDLAVDGSGFLVLHKEGSYFYTRTGSFEVDPDGYIVLTGTDYRLTMLDDAGVPQELTIAAHRTDTPEATTRIKFAHNLSSTATEHEIGALEVYNAEGELDIWQVMFERDQNTTGSQWTVIVTNEAGTEIGRQQLKFINGIVDPATRMLTFSDSENGRNVEFDFSENVTSFSSGQISTLQSNEIDGYGIGDITSLSANEDGNLIIQYSNEQTEDLGGITIADFRDPQVLEQRSSGLFIEPTDGGREFFTSSNERVGLVRSRRIEASNVDLSASFGELILVQRGFQASSQVVSASNDMIQQLFGIRGQG